VVAFVDLNIPGHDAGSCICVDDLVTQPPCLTRRSQSDEVRLGQPFCV
jgi:hypothetical protein